MVESHRESWFRRTLVEQPAFLVSALYLLASLIGLFYSWAFLRPFGINMLQYAEVSDFLLASIKEPLTWGLALCAVALVQLDNIMSQRVEARRPNRLIRWYGSVRYRRFNYIVSIFIIAVFLFLYADINAEKVRAGEGEWFDVKHADDSEAEPRMLLGTTVNFIFLFDHESGRVSVHPNESVLGLSRLVPGSLGEPTQAESEPAAEAAEGKGTTASS